MKQHLGGFRTGPTPPETCPWCAVKHDADQPHNAQSLAYQYKFYEQHGRWPDWRDAMAHCSDRIKTLWREELMKKGVDVDGGKVNPERVKNTSERSS